MADHATIQHMAVSSWQSLIINMLVNGNTTWLYIWINSILETYWTGTVHKKGHNILPGSVESEYPMIFPRFDQAIGEK